MDVFGLQEIEDRLIVGIGLPGEVEMRIAGVIARSGRSTGRVSASTSTAAGFVLRRFESVTTCGRYSSPFQTSTRTGPGGTSISLCPHE